MNPVGKCRACGSTDLTFLFSLGEQYLSDFVTADRVHSVPKCPIELELCAQCSLVQARYSPPADLYGQRYWFRSSSSRSNREALADVARAVEGRVPLAAGDVVLDLGSNDGTLLRSYKTPGIVRVGVEPAPNLREEGSRDIDVFIDGFWSWPPFCRLMQADARISPRGWFPGCKAISAAGMIYDLPDPNAFVADVAKALAPDGVFAAQMMCARQTVEKGDVGNLCHEHLLFFSLRSLHELFHRHGLEVFDLEENAVNGGSYRLWVRHIGNSPGMSGEMQGRVTSASLLEGRLRLDDPATWRGHAARMRANADRLAAFVRQEVAAGKRVHVRGASTKGNVILQHAGLDASLIGAASDGDPNKHGLYTAGTGIRIVSPEESRAMRPDYYLCLPYAFRDELIAEEREHLARGGRMAFALPEFEVV